MHFTAVFYGLEAQILCILLLYSIAWRLRSYALTAVFYGLEAQILCILHGNLGQGGNAKSMHFTWQHGSNEGARLHETMSTYHH